MSIYGHTSMPMSEFWKNLIPQHYDIDEITNMAPNTRGCSHSGYEVGAMRRGRKSRYFLRLYRKNTGEKRIRFEHALLERLSRTGFRHSPHQIFSMNGKFFEMIEYPTTDGPEQRHIAMFEFLPGEDKYEWHSSVHNAGERRDAARILAKYHNLVSGWRVPGEWNSPTAADTIPRVVESWRDHAKSPVNTEFDCFLKDNIGFLLDTIGPFSSQSFLEEYRRLPQIVIHGDYHPGNLKYSAGKVVAMLDFELANTDARLIDVAFALRYFCIVRDAFDGKLAEDFLGSYESALAETPGIGPLTSRERDFLPGMIRLSNLHMIYWIIETFQPGLGDESQHLNWLRREIGLARTLLEFPAKR